MKRGGPEHPKTLDLAERLKCGRATAVGHLELLFHFTAKYAPQGDIGRYSDRQIESALDWSPGRWKRDGELIKALLDAGWLESHAVHRLIVHHWHHHADDSVRKRMSRAGLSFLTDTSKVSRQTPDSIRTGSAVQSDNGSLPEPEPEPEPEPAARCTGVVQDCHLRESPPPDIPAIVQDSPTVGNERGHGGNRA